MTPPTAPALARPLAATPTSLPAHPDRFVNRHCGPRPSDEATMLATIGCDSIDDLMDRVVPDDIRISPASGLPTAASEHQVLAALAEMAGDNRVCRNYLGQGYHETILPPVIRRSVLENPGWYTQYTPYQAEISQGRLRCLLTFQTVIADLTGLPVANASLLDEATAVAEAVALAHAAGRRKRARALVADDLHPRSLALLATRCERLGVDLDVRPYADLVAGDDCCAVVVQNPATDGQVRNLAPLAAAAHQAGALIVCATDLLACTLIASPGAMGVDIAVGSAQRFGVPLFNGGPHAGFISVREAHQRLLPGRLVGVSRDVAGNQACRLSLQTREQHIRREKATSNICTAQALLANIAALYAAYHGPEGLRAIAERVHAAAAAIAAGANAAGLAVTHEAFFDTVEVAVGDEVAVRRRADAAGINLWFVGNGRVRIALGEPVCDQDVDDILMVLTAAKGTANSGQEPRIPVALQRETDYLQQEVFHRYRSETAMLRHVKELEAQDLSLTASMIPLGSCTMKLNAAAELLSLTLPGIADIHPCAPEDHKPGYRRMLNQLGDWLCAATGLAACSLQPNAGAQGEYAGLLAITAWHRSRGDHSRDVCLIPRSAHGTNPATAAMAGLRVVTVACDQSGDVDLADLDRCLAANQDRIAALMLTYPSTHGVFERQVRAVCARVHEAGGQVYLDGANLNAQLGWTSPAAVGADVCHLNLHKTFAIPHGGGGPGVGPICVAAHLAPFLPDGGTVGAVSQAVEGSAAICSISWAYIALMGGDGLRRATATAVLAANYLARRLGEAFPVLYRGQDGFVAHECILDLRPFKKSAGIDVTDVAKRLMDYGFHAPTVSFPVPGTLMVEPTESEDLVELDRFVEAMLAIRAEIEAVAEGRWPRDDNPLVNAPHTAAAVTAEEWPHPYSRTTAAWPVAAVRNRKYWPPVARIDDAWGDRHLFCACS